MNDTKSSLLFFFVWKRGQDMDWTMIQNVSTDVSIVKVTTPKCDTLISLAS
jgi:hypothetical protein